MDLRCDTRPREHLVLTIGSRRRRDTDKSWPIEICGVGGRVRNGGRVRDGGRVQDGGRVRDQVHQDKEDPCLCLGVWGMRLEA